MNRGTAVIITIVIIITTIIIITVSEHLEWGNCHMTRASCYVSQGLCIVWSDRRDNGCPPWTEKRMCGPVLKESTTWGRGKKKTGPSLHTVSESTVTWAVEPDSTSVQNRCTIVSWPCVLSVCVCGSHCIKTNKYQPLYHSSTLGQVGTVPCYIKKGDNIYIFNT